MLRVLVLGSAAGGGFPQWNSNAPACRRARRGDAGAKPRSQCAVAVSGDNESWFLLNAPPDLRTQIEAHEVLHPREGLRSSPIAGVVLTGSDVDAVAGLLHLRERQALTIYATAPVLEVLASNPIFRVLARDCVVRTEIALGCETALASPQGEDSRLRVEMFAVPGKVALYLEEPEHDPTPRLDSGTIGLRVTEAESRAGFFFVPGCAAMTPGLAARLRGAELVFFDGTLWRDDEMIRQGVGSKTGRRMGHMSMSGEDGAIAACAGLAVKRKVFIHINNTNPVLLEDSPERAAVAAAGWEVAYDGMEIRL